MTPLDTLYGAGSSARFAELVTLTTLFPETTTTITEQTQKDSSVHVETTWAVKGVQVALWKLDYYPNYVKGTGLHVAEAFRGKGLYRFLIVHVTPWWESLGLLAHTASPWRLVVL
jgi:GNAT superfamily N-acetyltransferase